MHSKIQMKTTNLDVSIEEAMTFFLRKCKVKNLTELSINSYSSKCQLFINFYGNENHLFNISETTIPKYGFNRKYTD